MRRPLLALLLASVTVGTAFAQTEPLLQLQGQPYSGGSATLHLSGDVGQQAFVFYGLNPLDPPLVTAKGNFFIGTLANGLFIGTIPPAGRLDMPFTVPPLHPALAGIPLVLQGFVPGALSNPATLPLDQPYYVAAAAVVLESPTPTGAGSFGDRIATGDINDDGATDIVVGAWKESHSGMLFSGSAYVFWGPLFDTTTTLSAPAPFEWGLFGQGIAVADLDSDGFDDVVVSEGNGEPPPLGEPGHLYVFHGSSSFSGVADSVVESIGTGVPYQVFGHFSEVGDFNDDNSPDIAISASIHSVSGLVNAGRIEVYWGPDLLTGSILIAPDVAEDGFFGDRLASGDINGDSVSDLVVGAPRKKLGGVSSLGRVYVFTNPGLVHAKTIDHPDPDGLNSRFGNAVVAHDMDSDGLADVIATDQRNHCYVFWAPTFDSYTRIIRPPDPTTGSAVSISFGYYADAGDANGDGIADIVIGEPFAAGTGRSYIALGPYLSTFQVLLDKSPEDGAFFGWGVHLRDASEDRKQELLVGSEFAGVGTLSGAGHVTIFQNGP